jgi:hypothetical protein
MLRTPKRAPAIIPVSEYIKRVKEIIAIRGGGLSVNRNPASTRAKESHPNHQINIFIFTQSRIVLFAIAISCCFPSELLHS